LANKGFLKNALGIESDDDNELLVAAWKAWGKHMVDNLKGSYAFVLWDDDTGVAFAAVDRFGTIPFYYHKGDGFLVASTALNVLATIPHVRGGRDRIMIAEYLLSTGDGPALGNQTFFEGIKRLPAGHSMVFDSNGLRLSRYRRLSTSRVDLTEDDAATTFRNLLSASVDRYRDEGSTAVQLSGGLDSSTIAALVRSRSATYPALHFHSSMDDESDWAKMVVDQGGLDLHLVECRGFMDTVDEMLAATAEPWAYENLHHDYLLLKRGHALGCGTVMGGYYGDVTVSDALDYLKPWADAGDWSGFYDECKKAGQVQGRSPDSYLWYHAGGRFDELAQSGEWRALWTDLKTVARIFQIPLRALAWHFWLRPFTPKPFRRLYRIATGAERPVWWEMNRQLNPDFASAMELNQRALLMKDAWLTPLKDAVRTHENLIYHDSTAITLTQLHALSRHAGAMAVHPFMDDDLVEFCLSLPRSYHGRDGWDRWITREAMKGILADPVRLRTERTNYGATALAELRNETDAIDAFVADWPAALDEYVDRDAFEADWAWSKEETELSLAVTGAGRRIHRTVILGKWLQTYG
jgi:asparagine synthase (glutamine-hydrolysing)